MHLSYYQHLSCDKSSTALSFNAKLPVSTKYTRVNVHRSLVVFRMLKGFRKLNWCCVSALVVLSLVTLESSLGNGSQSIYSSIYLSFYLSIYISVSHSLEAVGHVGRHADGSWNTGSPKFGLHNQLFWWAVENWGQSISLWCYLSTSWQVFLSFWNHLCILKIETIQWFEPTYPYLRTRILTHLSDEELAMNGMEGHNETNTL